MTTCDVLVIGAGVVGVTVAAELTARGADVVLVDRGRVGRASSALNAGGVRHQFFHEPNIRAAQISIALMQRFKETFGVDIQFRQAGYLFLYSQEAQAERFRTAIARQNACGVPSRLIGLDEVRALVPEVSLDGIAGGCFNPTDGYMDPVAVMDGLERAARESGVRIVEDAAVHAIEVAGQHAACVRTSAGDFSPGRVVNAAGAWAPGIAALYGETLPITPRRSQIFVMERTAPLRREMPHTFDVDAMVYIRIDGDGIRAGSGVKPIVEDPPAALEADWRESEELRRRVVHRMPVLASSTFTRGWAGLIEITPDNNPILGWSGIDNVYTAAGFSGHGMCIAPGLAPSIAADVLGTDPPMALDFYRPARFDKPDALHHESLWLTERLSDLDQWTAAPAR
jgi:sarcosine oxidase subunit beta